MTKLSDVALAAGVSSASASRALRGNHGVSNEVRERILAAATRLRYQPNLAARALARRSGFIAIALTGLSDPLARGAAEVAGEALESAGFRPMIMLQRGPVHRFDGLGLSGVLFIGRAPSTEECDGLVASGVPSLVVADSGPSDTVGIELGRVRGMALACRYLENQGHRRALVLVSAEGVDRSLQASQLGDGPLLYTIVKIGEWSEARAALLGIINRPDRPTAIVCDTDSLALAVLGFCASLRIGVPEGFSIIGFGDESFARHSRPTLSTVRVSTKQIGSESAKGLLDLIAGARPRFRDIEVKLVLRESSGAPG